LEVEENVEEVSEGDLAELEKLDFFWPDEEDCFISRKPLCDVQTVRLISTADKSYPVREAVTIQRQRQALALTEPEAHDTGTSPPSRCSPPEQRHFFGRTTTGGRGAWRQ
jgi:hypothetical protein